MRVEPFKPEHFLGLAGRANTSQMLTDAQCTVEYGELLASSSQAFTGFVDDKVMAIAGTLQLWTGRLHLWAFLAIDSGPHMRSITRAVKKHLDGLRCVRLEAEVSEGFKAGHQWMRMLGFKLETPNGMDDFFPGNVRGYLYSKVQ